MIYGMYFCMNIVTEENEYPAAILIRALEPISDSGQDLGELTFSEKFKLASGPGKLCRWLDIDREFNGKGVENGSLFIESDEDFRPGEIIQTERIGVDYAVKSAKLKWRYYLGTNKFVSRV